MKREHRARLWFTAGAVLVSLSAFALVAAAKLSKTGASTTTFKASGPAGLTIAGTTSDMDIADDGTTVTIRRPSYLGVTVKPDVGIDTSFQAND